jgi:hypothetical protein
MAFLRLHLSLACSLLLGPLAACSGKPENKAQAPSPEVTARPVLSASLDQIQNQYASDRAAAERKFADTAVQFTAIAATVAPEAGNVTDIAFKTAQHPEPIIAHFTSTPDRPATAVRSGAMVQAKCNSIAVAAGKLELNGCILR